MEPNIGSKSFESASRRRVARQKLILLIGLLAIIASLAVRNSRWAHERRLKNLNLEELALAIHDEPNDSLTFLYYGSALISATRAVESEQAFSRAVKLDPNNERALLGLASAQFRQNKLPEAQVSFETAIKLNPKDKEAYLGLAQTLYRQGYALHAAEPLKKILALDPNSGPAWYFLGKMYGDAHGSDLALDALQHAVKADPAKGIYWRDLAQLSRHYSRNDEAEEQLKKALHYSPNDPVAYLWLGQLYLQMGDTPKLRGQAEQCFESATSRDPQMQEAFFGLGELYERSNNYSVAEVNFRKAYDLDQSDDKALHFLGECLMHEGKTAEGKKLLSAAMELETAKRDLDYLQKRILAEPKNRDLRLRLARLSRKYDNTHEALNQYAAYQNLGAEDPVVRKEMEQYQDELIKRGLLSPRPGAMPSSDAGTP